MSARFDWKTAKTLYCSDEQVSYMEVSKKFGMSTAAIKQYQKRMGENWPRLRKETLQKVAANLPTKLGETLASVQARQARMGRHFQERGLFALERENIKPKTAREARLFILAGVALERKALGMDLPENRGQVNVPSDMSIIDLHESIQQRISASH